MFPIKLGVWSNMDILILKNCKLLVQASNLTVSLLHFYIESVVNTAMLNSSIFKKLGDC